LPGNDGKPLKTKMPLFVAYNETAMHTAAAATTAVSLPLAKYIPMARKMIMTVIRPTNSPFSTASGLIEMLDIFFV